MKPFHMVALVACGATVAGAQRDTSRRVNPCAQPGACVEVKVDDSRSAADRKSPSGQLGIAPASPDVVVRTVPLKHLSSSEAMQLLQPYVRTVGGGVYAVFNVQAITIREKPAVFAEMEKVLAEYDRSPATITLSFQLIAAEDTPTRDPQVAGLDSLLRGVLRFNGYRLMGTAVATAGENDRVAQTLGVDSNGVRLDVVKLDVRVDDIRTDANGVGTVHMSVRMTRPGNPFAGDPARVKDDELLFTGVNVQLGQTVVLGTTAVDAKQGMAKGLILTVRPQIASSKPRKE